MPSHFLCKTPVEGVNINFFDTLMVTELEHNRAEVYQVYIFCVLVGKTSLITRFMYDSFDNTYQVSVDNSVDIRS